MGQVDVTQRFELIACLRKAADTLMADYGVVLVYLYGSTAQGFTTPLSDVDIALVLQPDRAESLSAYDRLLLEMDVSIALQQHCSLDDVDVRVVNGAPIELQGRIVSEGILLYAADENFRVGYETFTIKRFLDFRPFSEAMRQAYFDRRRAELASEESHG